MEVRIFCGTWITKYDRLVIDYIKLCDVMPSLEEICIATELPESRVKHTLAMLRDQQEYCEQLDRERERDKRRYSRRKQKKSFFRWLFKKIL